MLTPNYLLHVADGAVEIASQMHTDIIKRIIDRIQARSRRGDDYILTAIDKWQIQTLLDSGYLMEDIQKEIAKYTGYEESEIKEAMEEAGMKAIEYDERIYRKAGLSPLPLRESPYMMRLMQRNYEATMQTWRNFTATTANATQQAFINAMDNAYNQVSSGSISYIQAYTEAIEKIISVGVVVDYPSGHTDTIETAALRCLRTGISQMSGQIQIARMDEMDVDLVLVSSHMGARPSHQEWQGKVYSRSGNDKKYPDFISSTGYGTGDGLCGWNCRHNFSPYFEGMENPFERYDDDENKELYEKTQKQRSMERAIRKTKRQADNLKYAANNEKNEEAKQALFESYEKKRQRLKLQNDAYKQFCEDNDLRPLRERLQIAKIERDRRKDRK